MTEPRVARLYEALDVSPPFHDVFSFALEGVGFEGRIDRGSKDSLLGAKIWTSLGAHLTAADITLRRERVVDRVGKWLRINREYRCGDRDFDDACYIEGEVPDATLAPLFASAAVRRHVLALLGADLFGQIRIEADDRLFFYLASSDFSRGAEVVRALVGSRALVAELLTAHRESEAARGGGYRDLDAPAGTDVTALRLPSRIPRIVGVVVFDLLGFAGFLGLQSDVLPLLGSSPLQTALLVTFCAAHLAALVALLRGRANSLRLVITFALLGVAADLFVSTQALPRLDIALDHSPLREVEGRVVPVREPKGTGWHWEAHASGVSVPVDLPVSAHGADPAGRAATFLVGDGAFGVPWIAGTTLR